MTNSLVGDHQVAVVDEGVLEGSDMSGTLLNRFLVKNWIYHEALSPKFPPPAKTLFRP